MSQLKQVVENSLQVKGVSPEILNNLDTYIQRSVIRLQNREMLPPRTMKFTSVDRKEEMRDGDELLYNFYYLPDDFRSLYEFKPRKTKPYNWISDITSLLDKEDGQKWFTIEKVDFNGKYENILAANPFPEDEETVEIKYLVNGHNIDLEWLNEDHWEPIIVDVENMLNLASAQEVEDRVGDTTSRWKEPQGHNTHNKAYRTLKGKFFGNRR